MMERYAIYFTLSQSEPLYKLASAWLGYDAYAAHKTNLSDQNLDKIFNKKKFNHGLTSSAEKYGFHATLKPPFRLQQGKTRQQLIRALEKFCSTIPAFSCAPLKVKSMGHFLALAPKKSCDQLDDFAALCLQHFEPFRAELNSDEVEKRKPVLLSDRQLRYLEEWGYPYVEDEFRFHMTLTDSLPEEDLKKTKKKIKNIFNEVLGNPLVIDRVHLFQQDTDSGYFHIVSSHKLKKPAATNSEQQGIKHFIRSQFGLPDS